MKPIDIRNETFAEINARLNEEREVVYRRMLASDEKTGTVRDWADRFEMELSSIAPRITELYQMGAVELVDRCERRGIYRARTEPEWMLWHGYQRAGGEQMQLGL